MMMITGTERTISLPRQPLKNLERYIFFHLESIWELALSRIHGFNSDIKVAPFPNEEEEIISLSKKESVEKRK